MINVINTGKNYRCPLLYQTFSPNQADCILLSQRGLEYG